MKRLHTTTYKLYNKDNIRISILSDIHFSHKVKTKLDKLLKHLNSIKPNYILIPGDLIDSTDMIEETKEKERLLNWIKELSKTSKVIISLGNHDMYKIRKKRIIKNRFKYSFPLTFFNEIKSIDNVYLLNNEKYEDDLIYIVGLTAPFSYYSKEKSDILLNHLEKNKELVTNLPNNKLKILLFHSPVNLVKNKILERINEFNYFITGHMHNGCVPPLINELWNSNKGIIAPSGKLFASNERTNLRNKEDKLIINGPVTTFQSCSGIMQMFNIFYPIYNTILEFDKDNTKIIRKRKYHK